MPYIENLDRHPDQRGPLAAPLNARERSDRPADRQPVTPPADRNEARQTTPSPTVVPERPDQQLAPEPPPAASRRRRLRQALFALLPLALIAGGYWYVIGGAVMSTDDAYVEANKVGISTDVSGIVKEVDVTENQPVATRQVLYRLEPRQFQIALDQAKANLAQTALTIESMKQDYKRMLSDVATEQAQVALDQATYDRNAGLLPTGATTRAAYDQARFTLEADKSKLESLRQQAQVQLARLNGNAEIPTTQHPQYLQAKAQVDEAQRQLDDTVVKAPFAGIVTSVPSIAPGKYLQASTTAFYLVATDHVWVDANPKETELTYVRPGQPVTITVDTYPDLKWHGTVESISPAAAQEFQLLPAQNTSGNWVKVVQRVPMRVRVDTGDQSRPPLRAGMSVEVDVDTGHARGVPHFLAGLIGGEKGNA
jgi:membrane fusion protein, multidrug efflux system